MSLHYTVICIFFFSFKSNYELYVDEFDFIAHTKEETPKYFFQWHLSFQTTNLKKKVY